MDVGCWMLGGGGWVKGVKDTWEVGDTWLGRGGIVVFGRRRVKGGGVR